MATVRPTRITAAKRGTGTTAIDGVTAAGWQFSATYKAGSSDADIGITSLDITGWNVTGFLEVDDHSLIKIIEDLTANAVLWVYYKKAGSATGRIRKFHKVVFEGAQAVRFDNAAAGGSTSRYRMPFEALMLKLDGTTAATTPGHVTGASPSNGACTLADDS